MPKSCCVTFCTNNNKKNPNKKFFLIPSDSKKRKSWLAAINRAAVDKQGNIKHGKLWSPKSKWTYVCSDHFITGERSFATSHPDYVPSIFSNRNSTLKVSPWKSPHRQRLVRFHRRSEFQNKPVFSKKILYQSPDFTTEEPCCSKSLEEDNNQDPEYMVVGQQEDYTSSEVCTVSNTSSDILTLATPVSNSERTQIYLEMDALRKERDLLQNTNDELRNTLKQSGLRYAAVIQAPDKCLMLTGLKVEILSKLVSYLSEGFNSSFTKPYKLSFPDQIILTIIKLKHNIVFELLAFVYGVGVSTAIDYFWNWLDIMYVKLKGLVKMQDRDYIFQTIPSVFKSKFPRLTSIIDCFEVFIESPSSLLARAKFYSQYKKHCTIKVLISCTPLGAINFVSQCYGGRTSDIQIVKESGFHFSEYHMPGDQILADRGFNLRDEFAAGSSSELLIPSFTRGKKQLSAKEVETSRKIASVRIHIERVIGLLRNRYTILKGTIPLRTVNSIKAEASSSTLASCDKIVNVCAALTNLCDSIVYK